MAVDIGRKIILSIITPKYFCYKACPNALTYLNRRSAKNLIGPMLGGGSKQEEISVNTIRKYC